MASDPIAVAQTSGEARASRAIEYLSQPAAVSMADSWFAISSTDHFWVRRRFAVLQKLAGHRIQVRKRFSPQEWSYWGLPLVPAVLVRKLWLFGERDQGKIITAGFDSRSGAINKMMGLISRCEWLPARH